MNLLAVVVFAATLGLACAIPGPSILALASGALGRGPQHVLPMIPGLVIGELLWLACAALGAAGLARQHAVAFTAVKYLGAAYLVYFAWRTWHSSRFDQTVLPTRTGASRMTVMSGLALSLGNPKTMLFYLAILPSVIDLHATSPVELGILELAAACTTLCIYLLYTFATARVRVAFRSPKSMAAFRIGAAICMVLAAALVVVR